MECKVRESKRRLIAKRPNERNESDALPVWLKEWYQLRKNNVGTKELIQLNAPNTFPVRPFWNTLRHKQVVTDDKGQPARDPDTGWVKLKTRYEGQYPQWSQSWLAARQEYEDYWLEHKRKGTLPPFLKEEDGIYRGHTPPKHEPGYVVVCTRIWYSYRQKRKLFSFFYLPKDEMPRKEIILDRRDRPKHEKRMRDLIKTHGKYVQCRALNYFLSHRYLWENRLGCFLTIGKRSKNHAFKQHFRERSEDLESILWEALLLGKGRNKEAVRFALVGFLDDKMQTKRKYKGVDFVSLPEDKKDNMKLERFDVERLRRKWEMSIAGPVHDEENIFSQG